MLTNPSVSVSGFTKVYGKGNNKKIACNNVDFFASSGGITGVLGLNGAGKSTLLKAICGVHYPTEGSICVCKKTLLHEIRSLTSFVPELPELDLNLTVKETLFFASDIHLQSAQEKKESVTNAIKQCGLQDVLCKKVKSLSKGYMQRTSLALALASNTPVLVLDEFSAGLDPAQIVQMRTLLKKIAETKCVIFSTHHIEEAKELCKNIFILLEGKIVASGSPEDIIKTCKKNTLEQAFLYLCNKENKSLTFNGVEK